MEKMKIFKKMPIPYTLIINITNKCNSKCLYCDHWKQAKKQDVDKCIYNIISECKSLGTNVVRISGGEPFLNQEILNLIYFIKKLSLISMVCTNGRVNFNMYKKAIDAGLDCLSVTLGTLLPDIYFKVHGVDITDVIKNLEKLLEYRKHKKFIIVISYPISKLNIKDIDELLIFTQKNDLYINFTPLYFGIKPEDDMFSFSNKDTKIISKIIEKVIKAKNIGCKVINSDYFLLSLPNYLCNRHIPDNFSCQTGFHGAIIENNLDVKLCYPLSSIGNLKDSSFNSVWYSNEAKELRKKMLNLDCPKCWLSCHIERKENLLANAILS